MFFNNVAPKHFIGSYTAIEWTLWSRVSTFRPSKWIASLKQGVFLFNPKPRFFSGEEAWFGIEQEYTLFEGRNPLGWPEGGYPAPQGPFYCGVGADEVFGRDIVEEHLELCMEASFHA